MTAEGGRDTYREWDAAYVLGALEPDERREFEQHLQQCPACAAAVGELAGLPGMLRGVAPEDVRALVAERVAPVGDVVSLARAASARRRRGRWLGAGAAAACLALGVAAGVALPRSQPPAQAEVVRVRLEPVGALDVHADLTMRALAWGTRLDWSCEYPGVASGASDGGGAYRPPAEGPVYELVVVDEDGGSSVVATWRGHDGRARGLGASSALPAGDIARVEIRVEGATDALASADV